MSNLQKTTTYPLRPNSSSELLTDLSERDQETISAGMMTFMYLEQEIIEATSSNDTEIENLSGGSGGVPLTSGRTSQQATYNSKRTTFAFGGLIPINSVASFISNIIHLF
ncbi:hypothetical protein [Acaryochloris sp. IP29b_bin.148]|uniref:hypothetical protein n=1 Tax=Acaryochloris sp. IP29b_bin.148 TaxID=2969218 RepID=UPI002621838B|nr:hypothetical protein [Acaryochloris sp. IP29b_bin.148]